MILLQLLVPVLCGGALEARAQPSAKYEFSLHDSALIEGIKAIDKGQWTAGKKMMAESGDPLAARIYYWLLFTNKKGNDEFIKLTHFIRNNPHWPGIRELRLMAEKNIPQDFPDTHVMAWFKDYPALTPEGMAAHLRALMGRGYTRIAGEYIDIWWGEARFSRDDQRYLYKIYKNIISPEAHKKRLNMLLYAGDYENARAIAAVLGDGYRQLAEARIALATRKGNVNGLINKVPPSLQNDIGLQYERLRWRRRNDLNMRAAALLESLPPGEHLENPSEWWRERHILIRRFMEKKDYDKAYRLAADHRQTSGFSYVQAEWMTGWLALRFMNKPLEGLHRFEALYEKVNTPISRSRAAYWAGRSLQAMGHDDLAQNWFKLAGQYQTTFYGQLGASELSLAQALPVSAPPKLSREDRETFSGDELVHAAKIFHEAGMRKEASRFLRTFIEYNETAEAYRYAAELAASIEQFHDAIKIAKEATAKGMFLTAQAYPVIVDRLKGVDLEWSLIHALIRQESAFDFDAMSPAGARGLMQLMPATAKDVARRSGLKHRTSWLTTNPEHNIALGTHYLRDMLLRFEGSYPLAIAAYNAGPNRVEKWLELYGDPRFDQVDFIDWIEMIPVYETRNYVQRVMEGIYVYRLRLEGIQKPPRQPLHIAMR